jgi:hypothetical protein
MKLQCDSFLLSSMHQLHRKIYALYLLITICCIACSPSSIDTGLPQILSNQQARQAATEAFTWLEHKVSLMITHKADCEQMAKALLQHHFKYQDQLKQWRKYHAQDWMKARSQVDEKYKAKLNTLMNQGDTVYSFCSFFESFRSQLRDAVQIGL